MTTTPTYCYRGYEIVPKRQWASWCACIYPARADLPLIPRSYTADFSAAEGRSCGRGEA